MDAEPFTPAATTTPVIPDHELIRRIGGGSYGDVWLARNVIGAFRAVKIVHRSTFADARPFEREFNGIQKYEPVSRTHPGLVQVLQVGRNNEAGYFYYVMEVGDDACAGQDFHPDTYSARTLSQDVATRGRLEFDKVVELGIELADALGHLHRRGLIHRDIKPSNIIFVNGRPKLADIGLVVSVGESNTIVGTEGFIAPEGPTSPQADIYSFGKVLYEISTGNDRNAFPDVPEVVEDIATTEQFAELNEILVKACAPAAAERYPDADALRHDLELLRAGKSVRRLRVLERRIWLLTRVLVIGLITVIVGLGVLYTINSSRQRQKQLRALAYIEGGARQIENRNFHAAIPYFAQALDLQASDASAAELQRLRIGMLLRQGPQLLQIWTNVTTIKSVEFLRDGKRLLVVQKPFAQIFDIVTRAPVSPQVSVSDGIFALAMSPDDSRLVVANDKKLQLFDSVSGQLIRTWQAPKKPYFNCMAFRPDGKRVVSGCSDGGSHVFDLESPDAAPIVSLENHRDEIECVCFSPDGKLIMTCGRDKIAQLWDAETGRKIGAPLRHDSWVHYGEFSPSGQQVVTASHDQSVRIWDVRTQMLATRPMDHRDAVRRACFSPDGAKIVTGANDETVAFWDASSGRQLGTKFNHDKQIMAVAFDRSGRRLATADHGGTVKVWDVEPEPPIELGNAFFSPDGARYVVITNDVFTVFDAVSQLPLSAPIAAGRVITAARFVAEGQGVALTASNSDTVAVCLADASEDFRPRKWLTLGPVKNISFSPSGRVAFAAVAQKQFAFWDVEAGRQLGKPLEAKFNNPGAVFSPDGKIAAITGSKRVSFVDVAANEFIGNGLRHAQNIRSAMFSRDGRRFVAMGTDEEYSNGLGYIWDWRGSNVVAGPFSHDDGVLDGRLDAEEKLLITASEDQYARVWNAQTGKLLIRSERHNAQVRSAMFDATAKLFLTLDQRQTVRVIETATGYPVIAPVTSAEAVTAAGFVADRRGVWIRFRDRTVMVPFVSWRRSLTELKEIIGALGTGQILRGRGAWDASDADLWRSALDRVVEPGRMQRCADDIPRWHERAAAALMRGTNWNAARFHYRSLLDMAPTNAHYAERLAFIEQQLKASRTSP